MIYHTPEEFVMRDNDYNHPHLGAWRAYYKTLVEAGVYVGANALSCPRQEPQCVLGKEPVAYRMAHTPIQRSNWQDSSSWNSLRLTPPSNGLRDAQEHQSAQWKSDRWRPRPCGGVSQGEWNQSG